MSAATDRVVFSINGNLLCVDVHVVQDILQLKQITRVPRAKPAVFGLINLRGRIITVIDPRRALGLAPAETGHMAIVIHHEGEDYAMLVDEVLEVSAFSPDTFSSLNRPDSAWSEIVSGFFRTEDNIVLRVDTDRLISLINQVENVS